MALEYRGDRVRTSIGPLRIYIEDVDGSLNGKSISAGVWIYDQFGEEFWEWNGNLQPHLTQTQIDGLVAFINTLRTQAEMELLP